MTGGAYSIPEVQRLLAVLAAGRHCAEIGTAFGIGAAAIASTAASLVTVEIDPERVATAREALMTSTRDASSGWVERCLWSRRRS